MLTRPIGGKKTYEDKLTFSRNRSTDLDLIISLMEAYEICNNAVEKYS